MNARYNNLTQALDEDIANIGIHFPLSETGSVLDGVVLKCAADLQPTPVRWLWRNWMALGKLHILAGAPGQGKTTLAMAMAATVSIGGRWPDGSGCDHGNVLIWTSEDDHADTLYPRLLASGANPKNCYFIEGARRSGEVLPFDPARDLKQLREEIEKIGGIKLLVIDPVVSAVAGDSHKNTEVRRALQPLVDLAAACDCAVLGITHFAKGGQGTDPTQRVVGSVAFTAVARVVMVAAKVKGDAENEDARILARTKSNIGPDGGGFHYFLEQAEPLPGIHASHVAWGKAVDGTARELLTDPEVQADGEDSSDSCELLRSELDEACWTNSETASQPLKAAGFSKKQIWQASKKLKVERRKDGMKGGWSWRLPFSGCESAGGATPEDSTEDSEDSTFGKKESSESSGALESSSDINLLTQLAHVAQRLKVEQVEQVGFEDEPF